MHTRIDRQALGAGHYLDTADARFHYARLGSGTPLLLLHGWPEFWYTWRHNIPALAARHTVIAPDLRGFGESRSTDRPFDAPLTPEQIADDLICLLDALAIDKAAFVAHDVSANAMQCLARRNPERISCLYFFNCPHPGIGARWADADQLPHVWYQYFNQLSLAKQLIGYHRDTCRLYLQHILGHWSHQPDCFDEDLEHWVDNFMAPGALEGGFAWYAGVDQARRGLIRHGPPELLPIQHPTRVLWGASDKALSPTWIDTLGSTFSQLEADVLPNAGHFVHYEQPDIANADIVRFLTVHKDIL